MVILIIVINLIVNQSSKFVDSTFMRLNQKIGYLFPPFDGICTEVSLMIL